MAKPPKLARPAFQPSGNPFTIGTLPEGAAFADRATEVARIIRAFRDPGGKLIVYGDRRLGKSATLEVAATRIRRTRGGPPVAIVDLSTASGPGDAANRILTTVHQIVGKSWRDALSDIARRLRLSVTLTLPAHGGHPVVSAGLDGQDGPAPGTHRLVPDVLDALEAELEHRNLYLGLGLDEFQRINEWGGTDAEWALRGALQRHRRIAYVMAGSARSLIESMVADKTRAFWKLADTLRMTPIDPTVMADWLCERAVASGVALSVDGAATIGRLAGPRTRDILQLARAVWDVADAGTTNTGTVEGVERVFEQVVTEQSALLAKVWAGQTPTAQQILRALAAAPRVELTAADTLRRYHLGAKSTVHQTVHRLIASEILAEGATPSQYVFDDPFFRRWVERQTLPDIGLPTPALDAPPEG